MPMKILIASDIHGDIECARRIIDIFNTEGCDRLLLLGDILYHGPRNDLPVGYAPKEVIALLNSYRDVILAVRGNCDTEVDQMVLDFPILADYIYLSTDGVCFFATHGHKYNPDSPPPLRKGEILLHGHTHIQTVTPFGDGNLCINPGSVSIPKGGNPKSYALYENKRLEIRDLDGKVINAVDF